MRNKENNKESLVLLDENVNIDKLMEDFIQKGIIPENHKHPKTFTRDIANAYFLSKLEKELYDGLRDEIQRYKDAKEMAESRFHKLEKSKKQFESYYKQIFPYGSKLEVTLRLYQNLIDAEKLHYTFLVE